MSVESRKIIFESLVDFFESATLTINGVTVAYPVMDKSTDVGWENVLFDTTGKAIWAGVTFFPNDKQQRTIGKGGFDVSNPFIQLDFNIPENTGEAFLLEWFQKVNDFFVNGRVFSENSDSVIVIRSQISQGRRVDSFFRRSFTIYFRVNTKRKTITNN